MSPDETRMQSVKIGLMIGFAILFFFFAFLVLNELDKIASNTNICSQKDCVCYEKVTTNK